MIPRSVAWKLGIVGVIAHWNSTTENVIGPPEIDVIIVKLNKIGRMDCPHSTIC